VLDPSAESDTDVLSRGEMQIVGHFVHGSNYTFLANLKLGSRQVQAVYKPIRGENPLWDFPNRTLAKREVAAFELSEWLGWHLVPPTVFRRSASLGAGSLQLFIEHDPNRHYFTLTQSEIQLLKPVALFDVIVNNADRKGSHLIFDSLDGCGVSITVSVSIERKNCAPSSGIAGEPIPLSLLGGPLPCPCRL